MYLWFVFCFFVFFCAVSCSLSLYRVTPAGMKTCHLRQRWKVNRIYNSINDGCYASVVKEMQERWRWLKQRLLKENFGQKFWIYAVLLPVVIAPRRRVFFKCMCLRRALVRVCMCVRSPLGCPPTTTTATILQHLPVWCQDLTPAVCLSLFSAKRQNPTRTPLKDCENLFLQKWMKATPPLPPNTHSLVGDNQNKDDMTSKSSRGKKHRSDVMCSLCVICWSLFMGVMSLRVGLSVPWYVTLTVKIKLSLSPSPFIYSLSRNFLLI